MRVVSLLPAATEIVAALGLEGRLVGRSHECDFPPSVARLPVLTRPKLELDRSSIEVDRLVRSLVEEGLSIYRLDAERLRELQPDVIITQEQCAVCAASMEDVEAAVREVLGSRPEIVSLTPHTLEAVWGDIRRIAEVLGVAGRGRELLERLEARMESLAEKTRGLPRPWVACLEWLDPLLGGGSWMPALVAAAGGRNRFGEEGKPAPQIDWQDLIGADPEVIVALPCGWGIGRARREMEPLARRPGWRELRAAREERVYIADGNQYFNRPGPRLVESAEILAEVLHPEACEFGHRGAGWQRR